MKKLLSKIINKETILYLVFGVLTTALNWGVYWLCCELFCIPTNNPSSMDAIPSFVSNVIAFIVGLIFAFVTNKIWVFESRDISLKKTAREFASFTVARLLTFGLESAILTIASFISVNLLITKIIANVLVVILNYVFSKLFIFKKNKN